MEPINITELTETADSGAAMVHISLSGALTEDRRGFLRETLRDLINKHRRIRVLLVLEDFEGTASGETYKELLDGQKPASGLERIAVVHATPGKTRETAAPTAPLSEMNRTRRFDRGETEEAIQWLKTD